MVGLLIAWVIVFVRRCFALIYNCVFVGLFIALGDSIYVCIGGLCFCVCLGFVWIVVCGLGLFVGFWGGFGYGLRLGFVYGLLELWV